MGGESDSCVNDGGCPFLPLPPSCLCLSLSHDSCPIKGLGGLASSPHTYTHTTHMQGSSVHPGFVLEQEQSRGREGARGQAIPVAWPTPQGIPWSLLMRLFGPSRAYRLTCADQRKVVQSASSSPTLQSPIPLPHLQPPIEQPPSSPMPKAAMLATPSDAGDGSGHQMRQGVARGGHWARRDQD